MQASTVWQPPVGTLGEILAETRKRVASLDGARRGAAVAVASGWPRASLVRALRGETVAVIAEVKRRSPSKGVLNPALDAGAQARRFERGGAAAISVITEPTRFGGSLDDLRDTAANSQLPMLRKDFHIAPNQLTEARDNGASGILLIARALAPRDLIALAGLARDLGLEPLIEVRTEAELEAAVAAAARIVGVNSRDLETLQVDESVPARLIPLVPPDIVAVWESGVRTASDVRRAAEAGADAVLVGSALSRTQEPESLLRELVAVPRRPRG